VESATGDYLAFLDHDDELAPWALMEMVRTIRKSDAELLYSDEDFIRTDTHLDFPHFKPDYSPDLLLSHNYITHLLVIKRTLYEEVGGIRDGFDGAQDYDLVLRAVERARNVVHVPSPLYHWRMSANSTSLNPQIKPGVHENARRALQDTLVRRNIDGEVMDGNLDHYFRVKRSIRGGALVSIVLPFKDNPGLLKDCIETVLELTSYQHFEIVGVSNDTMSPTTFDLMRDLEGRDSRVRFVDLDVPFNFSRVVNFGVSQGKGEHIVLLNNDIEIITPEWLENLLEHSQREEVAAVGGKLYYPNNTIQHAGIVIGLGGYAGHAHKNFPASSDGYFNRLNVIQNVSAVTGALLMTSRQVYEDLGGFDEEAFGVAYNDVDFCLRARERGLLNVFTPYVEAYHHESISRGYEDTLEKQQRFRIEMSNLLERHGERIKAGDPYYNPNLDQGRDDFSLPSV
jgi:GT2 family glycosyltransferase